MSAVRVWRGRRRAGWGFVRCWWAQWKSWGFERWGGWKILRNLLWVTRWWIVAGGAGVGGDGRGLREGKWRRCWQHSFEKKCRYRRGFLEMILTLFEEGLVSYVRGEFDVDQVIWLFECTWIPLRKIRRMSWPFDPWVPIATANYSNILSRGRQ